MPPMLDLAATQRLMTEAVPFNRVLGVRVESVAPEQVEVVLPAAPERLNHVGTVHAIAQFGLGEASAGAMLLTAFSDLQAAGAVPLVTEATIRYHKAARGDLLGVALLPLTSQQRIRAELQTVGKARFIIPVQLYDTTGLLTTELEVSWVLFAPRGQAPSQPS